MGAEALEAQRILAVVPFYGVDIRERELPQETEQARALNFNKGCYMGQEIVERIRSRGSVHRKFSGFTAQSGGRLRPERKWWPAKKKWARSPAQPRCSWRAGTRTIALGYIRRELGFRGARSRSAGPRLWWLHCHWKLSRQNTPSLLCIRACGKKFLAAKAAKIAPGARRRPDGGGTPTFRIQF